MRLAPMVDMIGAVAIEHGERADLDPEHPGACLCGRFDPYWLCDGPGIGALTVTANDDGTISVSGDDPTYREWTP